MYSLPFAEVTHSFLEETAKVNCRKSICVRRLHATSHDCIQVSNYSFDMCKFVALFPDNYIFKRAKFVFLLHTFSYFL